MTREGAPKGAPRVAAAKQDRSQRSGGMRQAPAGILGTPTLGAWHRAHGITDGRPLEAVHFQAVTIVDEALRQETIRRLDPVLVALDRHRRPAFGDIASTLRRLADDLDGQADEAVAA